MWREDDFIISLSGVRGIWEKGLTENKVYRLCLAASKIFKKNKYKKILIARDTRKSGENIFFISKHCFEQQGFSVCDLGILPVPMLQSNTASRQVAGALMITASHNPPEYNGLKFYEKSGKIFNVKQIEQLLNIYEKQKIFSSLSFQKGSILTKPAKDAYQYHFNKIFSEIHQKKIKKVGFKVVVDTGNGAASFLDKIFLEELGCKVFEINCQQDGCFRRKIEPLPECLSLLKKTVLETKADLGFAQDCDADRLAVADEKGNFLEDGVLLAIIVLHFLKNLSRKNKKVVVNLATSRIIDDVVKKFNGKLFKVPVGETNIIEAQKKLGALVGGEGHGGVIWPAICYGRDSFSAMALVLECLAFENKKLSEIVEKLPVYEMVKTKIPWQEGEKKLAIFLQLLKKIKWPEKVFKINTSDGLKIDFKESWIIIRSSNTEPILRIIAEAKNKEQGLKLLNLVKKTHETFKT